MAKKFSLGDILHYTNRRTYSHQEGDIAYLDGAPLNRPLSLPAGQRVIVIVLVAIAALLGFLFVNNTVLAQLRESAAAEQAIEDNLARQASIETIPSMQKLITMNEAGIRETFEEEGYTLFDASASTDDDDDLVLYKLPSDMTLEEASGMYARGINNLTAPQATKLLNGSWQFVDERSGITSMVTRYADFSTGDPLVAVQNAIQKTGFDPETITDSGKDDSGNTYSTGTFEIDDKTYVWKISALPLSDMYSINGMPEDACYVGVRATVQ